MEGRDAVERDGGIKGGEELLCQEYQKLEFLLDS